MLKEVVGNSIFSMFQPESTNTNVDKENQNPLPNQTLGKQKTKKPELKKAKLNHEIKNEALSFHEKYTEIIPAGTSIGFFNMRQPGSPEGKNTYVVASDDKNIDKEKFNEEVQKNGLSRPYVLSPGGTTAETPGGTFTVPLLDLHVFKVYSNKQLPELRLKCDFKEINDNNLYFYIKKNEVWYKTQIDNEVIKCKLMGNDTENNKAFDQTVLRLKTLIEEESLSEISTRDKSAILKFLIKRSHIETINNRKDIDPNTIQENRDVKTPPRTNVKQQEQQFDDEEIKKRKRRYYRSQHEVMRRKGVPVKKASATEIARKAGVISATERCEWLHLICHMMQGGLSQNEGNLVIGTYHANTTMIPVEQHLPNLKKYFGKNVTLKVSADLIQGTHFAKKIKYLIGIEQPEGLPPIEIKFEFDAFQKTASTRRVKNFIDTYMRCVYDKAAKDLDELLKEISMEELENTATALGKEEINKRFNEMPVSEEISDDIFDIEPRKLNFDDPIVPPIVDISESTVGVIFDL